jgi:hypothetical protein
MCIRGGICTLAGLKSLRPIFVCNERANDLAHLPPELARRDGLHSLFLAIGRRDPPPQAVRWSWCWAALAYYSSANHFLEIPKFHD